VFGAGARESDHSSRARPHARCGPRT
jgi:hypothetical protein